MSLLTEKALCDVATQKYSNQSYGRLKLWIKWQSSQENTHLKKYIPLLVNVWP